MLPALWPYGSHLRGQLCNVCAEPATEDEKAFIYSRTYVILENTGHMALLCLLFPTAVLFLSAGEKEGEAAHFS